MRRINSRLFLFACILTTIVSVISVGSRANGQDKSFQAIAPENCWAYSYWDAAGQYDAKSSNRTEQLLAEPEVKRFIEDIIERTGLIGAAMTPDRSPERQKLMHSIGPKLADIVFKRRGCFFLEKVKFDRRTGPTQANALLCLDAGADAVGLAAELSQMFTNSDPSDAPRAVAKVQLSGIDFNKFLINEEPKLEMLIGSNKQILIVALGEDTVATALKRVAAGKAPTWMANLASQKNVKRVTNFSHFNVKEISDTIAPLGDPQTLMAIGLLGLGNVNAIETSSGFSEDQSFSRMFIDIDGRPEGLLDLYSQKGLQLEQLQQIPDDSLFALAVSIDPNRVYRMLSNIAGQMNRRGNDFESAVAEIKMETGIDVKKDLIDNIGDSWTLHNGAADGWFTGLTLTGSVKSSEKLSAALGALVKKIITETDGNRYGPKFRKRTVGDNEIYSIQIPEIPFPIQASWCVSENRFILALFPQAIETALTPGMITPLIDQAKINSMSKPFSGEQSSSKIIAFAQSDTKSQFPFAYGYAQMVVSMSQMFVEESLPPQNAGAVAQLVRGIRLPPARVIHRHLGPSMMTARQTDAGIEIESTQTMPSLDAGYIAPIAIGALLPAVQQVRGAARRVTSMNNLRQLALAAHNFESVHKSFPAAYSVDDKGKKLLSWRVHILPFIEQNNLYDQFKFDEPWDSPHNKKLVKLMPPVFKSPVSNAEEGKTTYRSTLPKSGIIGPPKKANSGQSSVGFGQITDGSSNTIMYVETSDDLAQFWTKPDEGIDPANLDLKAIFGAYRGGTNVALGDGSSHFVSEAIDKASLKNLMQRSDGNIVTISDFNAEQARPRRGRYDREELTINPIFNLDNGDVELNIDNMLSKAEKQKLEDQKKLGRIRDIGLAFHNFESTYNKFPSAFTTDNGGKKLLSWRVQVLPFLEEGELFQKFKQDEPWDSEHNKALLSEMPEIFNLCKSQLGEGETTVLAMGGATGIFSAPSKNGPRSRTGVGFGNITDGSSNTLMLINAPEELAVEWTKPTEFDPDDAAIKLILSRGFSATLCDGSMWEFGTDLKLEEFKSMWSRNGGEIISPSDWSKR